MEGNSRETQTSENEGQPLGVVDGTRENDHGGRRELIDKIEKMGIFRFERQKEVMLEQCRDS